MATDDLSVAGPGSPVSLKKFLSVHPETGKPLTVLIDSTGCGIAKDDEDTFYITPEECKQQTLYYSKEVFDGRRVPAYLFRYINYMMFNDGDMKWANDQEVANAFIKKELTEQSDEYIRVKNFITYAEHNTEALQLIGFIQIFGGALNMARKAKRHIRIFIEQPETGLHPKRERLFISLFHKLTDEYGYKDLDEIV